MIWNTIQRCRRTKTDVHAIWLERTNAYGLVSSKLIKKAREFFYIPERTSSLVKNYYDAFQVWLSSADDTTRWQALEIDCTIASLLFAMAVEMVSQGFSIMVRGRGVAIAEVQAMPLMKSFMKARESDLMGSVKLCSHLVPDLGA